MAILWKLMRQDRIKSDKEVMQMAILVEERWKRIKEEVEKLEGRDKLWGSGEIWNEVERITKIAKELKYLKFPSDYLIEEVSEKAKQIIEQAKGVICPTMSIIGEIMYIVLIPEEAMKRKAKRDHGDEDYWEWLELTTGTVVFNAWRIYTDIGGQLTLDEEDVVELDNLDEDGDALGKKYDFEDGSKLIAEEESPMRSPWN